MKIKCLDKEICVCKVKDYSLVNMNSDFFFMEKTDEENSLVCEVKVIPENAIVTDKDWKAFRIEGILDFSLIGILSKIANILAENGISIFALSTYNTDYVLVKKENFRRAIDLLMEAGYEKA